MEIEQLVAYGTLIGAFAFALAVTAMIAAWRMARYGELIPYEPGPRAKSGLLEFALVFSCFLVGGTTGALAGGYFTPGSSEESEPPIRVDVPEELPGQATTEEGSEGTPVRDRLDPAALIGSAMGGLVAVLAIYLIWRIVLKRGPRTLAPSSRASTLGADVGLGFSAFLMSAAPVYGLQAALLQFFPEKHDLLTRLEEGLNPWLLVAAAFSAAVAAPVIEEIVFRGFLQSAFERLECGAGGRLTRLLFGRPIDADDDAGAEAPPTYESPAEFRRRGGTLGEGFRRTLAGIGSFPVVASAAIFALLHLGQGPAPIPLFLFALVLGYLYRQTGRLAAPIAAHFALNATTLLLAGVSMLNEASGSDPFLQRPPAGTPIEAKAQANESSRTDSAAADSFPATVRVR